MITATPTIQINTVDPSANPQANIMAYTGGGPILCPNSTILQDATLPAATVSAALSFPVGVTTAAFIFIAALTTTDLLVNVGTSPTAIPIPARQGIILYGLTSAKISVSSAAGGAIQYAIGG